jgi:hypothetical protein
MKIPYHVVSAISEDEIYYVIRVPKCVSNGHIRMADGDCLLVVNVMMMLLRLLMMDDDNCSEG